MGSGARLRCGHDTPECERRKRCSTFGVILILIASALTANPASPAAAHDVDFGYWNCWQQPTLASGNLRVGHTNLPADGWGDGVKNSFVDRAIDATARMGTALAARNSSGNGMTWVGTSTGRHIIFSSEALAGGVLGEARVGASCTVVHGAKKDMPLTITIAIDIRSDWFSQDDTRRAYWEGCPGSSYSGGYTCSKTMDVGSTMVHELGHAIRLAHPSQVANDGHGSSAMAAGDCHSTLDQATMCQAGNLGTGGVYRTHRRTLHSYDFTSISYHY